LINAFEAYRIRQIVDNRSIPFEHHLGSRSGFNGSRVRIIFKVQGLGLRLNVLCSVFRVRGKGVGLAAVVHGLGFRV